MAEEVREQRAEGRDRRRSLAAKPFEELDEAAGAETQPTTLDAAKGIAATAAAAAIAGALAGAAKAVFDRGSDSSDGEAQDDKPHEQQPEQAVQHDEPSDEEHETEPEDEEQQEAPQTADAQAEPSDDDADPEQPQAAEEEADEPSAEHDDESDGADGHSPSDAMRIVQQAREHLKNLLGEDAESVSGIERANGNWSVKLEVVELHRIPESTDILSSYSAVLDDDGGIVSVTRGRRYRRSQVEET
jgi:hypothetical protein